LVQSFSEDGALLGGINNGVGVLLVITTASDDECAIFSIALGAVGLLAANPTVRVASTYLYSYYCR
jgi:hypothetical protein